jgi:GDP-mannose 6-dehydrogenase
VTPQEALQGSDTAVVATSEPAVVHALRAAPPPRILDLSGRLGSEIERLTGYEGLGWTA